MKHPQIRQPAVAGQFYNADPARLRKELSEYMPRAEREKAIAIVSPHAGYSYSGSTAGALFSQIIIPETAIIISPIHRGPAVEFSLWPAGIWRTPLGDVEVDEDLSAALERNFPEISTDVAPHIREYSLEVQIPFLQMAREDIKIVPISIACNKLQSLQRFGEAIAATVAASGRDALLIASSDMNHFEDEQTTRVKDGKAIDAMLELDEGKLLRVVEREEISMCGVAPAAAAIAAAKKLGATSARLVKYATSGDASGDYTQVVGYAGIVVK